MFLQTIFKLRARHAERTRSRADIARGPLHCSAEQQSLDAIEPGLLGKDVIEKCIHGMLIGFENIAATANAE